MLSVATEYIVITVACASTYSAGRLVQIDFGFILEPSTGGNMRFESTHVKLSHEMTQLLDPSGSTESGTWHRFRPSSWFVYALMRTTNGQLLAMIPYNICSYALKSKAVVSYRISTCDCECLICSIVGRVHRYSSLSSRGDHCLKKEKEKAEISVISTIHKLPGFCLIHLDCEGLNFSFSGVEDIMNLRIAVTCLQTNTSMKVIFAPYIWL
ncbi:hypothetical protein Cgig2_020110 [Carnegiea gigantea]|uniref:Uncharacterized protein n=1 Tax=Carnegiea gigantea TaxID=171969 RepID=A0A9Q1KED4_9CARY|nr:hypothetical protein Cgig2_020110 [Carnegiea gigantea]